MKCDTTATTITNFYRYTICFLLGCFTPWYTLYTTPFYFHFCTKLHTRTWIASKIKCFYCILVTWQQQTCTICYSHQIQELLMWQAGEYQQLLSQPLTQLLSPQSAWFALTKWQCQFYQITVHSFLHQRKFASSKKTYFNATQNFNVRKCNPQMRSYIKTNPSVQQKSEFHQT